MSAPVNRRDPKGLFPSDDYWSPCANCFVPKPSPPSSKEWLFKCCQNEKIQLFNDIRSEACDCIAKATRLLNSHRDAVIGYYTDNPTVNADFILDNLDTLAGYASRAFDSCMGSGCTIMIYCCSSSLDCGGCVAEVDAYVNFVPFTNWRIGAYIHLCPGFWDGPDERKRNRLIHELGRMCNSLGESGTGTTRDVYMWDRVIQALCDNYERILTYN